MKLHCPENFETTINRWYIDTRPNVPQPHNPKSLHTLPLLSTLQHADQEAVTRFIRPADRFMSLASALLKYTFIHRRAKIPWSQVQISRTPAPHRRPYWEPPEDWSTIDIYAGSDSKNEEPCRIRGLEYNVSHQAGLVTIIGCSTPTAQLPSSVIPNPGPLSPTVLDSFAKIDLNTHPTWKAFDSHDVIRLGVDIACTNEDKRTPKDLNTQAKFDEWIEIFAEMFSDRERRHMRQQPIHVPVKERAEGDWSDSDPSSAASSPRNAKGESGVSREDTATSFQMKLRRFYAYWALKEAYIKMIGEGLLASWLRELEFLEVHAPPPPPLGASQSQQGRVSIPDSASTPAGLEPRLPASANGHPHHPYPAETAKWTPPDEAERGMITLFKGKRVEDVEIEVVAYDSDFMIATAIRGVREREVLGKAGTKGQGSGWWLRLDFEEDIRPCAEGRCSCLKEEA